MDNLWLMMIDDGESIPGSCSGWVSTPLKKYESIEMTIPNWMGKLKMFQTTNQTKTFWRCFFMIHQF